MLENLDLVLLSIDEVIDGGIVLETDAGQVSQQQRSRPFSSLLRREKVPWYCSASHASPAP